MTAATARSVSLDSVHVFTSSASCSTAQNKQELKPCINRSCGGGEWRSRVKSPSPLKSAAAPPPPPASSAIVPASPTPSDDANAPAPPAAASTAIALSRTPRFAPWLKQLEGQLLDMSLQIVRETTGESLESGAEERTEEDDDEWLEERRRAAQQEGRGEKYKSEHMEDMRRLGGSLSKLLQLVHQELLPRLPQDPEALFLGAAADFIGRRFESSLRLMQTALMATSDNHCTPKQRAAREYFLALIAIRIITEADKGYKEDGVGKMDLIGLPQERFDELCNITEKGLREAMRLDPRLHSAYIDSEMLAQLKHPDDAHARVAFHAEMVDSACQHAKYWVNKMQRPMHFYPKLESKPWWDASDFPWAIKLMQNFAEIQAEVLKMRQPATADKKAEVWDPVGSKHDAGDRELVENGAWTELVLLNRDEKVASMVARNRRLCPNTLRLLDSIPAASDMAKRGVGESTFSALHGGAHLKPHCGSTNCRLTCHLPLIVPKGEKASIRVGNETRVYREGEIMIFDDSWEHEVWQLGKKDSVRVVLLIRFWHPDIPVNRWPEAQHHMRKYYKTHKRRIQVPLLLPSKLEGRP